VSQKRKWIIKTVQMKTIILC